MVRLPISVVDAFASRAFRGNPAAVVDFGEAPFLPDAVLQAIARENNLAETAFVRTSTARVAGAGAAAPPRFHLRWFTPEQEINLCGHATLATAKVLLSPGGAAAGDAGVVFDSLSGPLTVTAARGGGREEEQVLTLDFPAWMPSEVPVAQLPPALFAALGLRAEDVEWAGRNRDLTVVLRSPAAVAAARLDARALDQVPGAVVVILAAAGDGAQHLPGEGGGGAAPDMVVRAFCPGCAAVPEDPVCGSAHCSLIPLFAARLGRSELLSHQLSARGGELRCALVGDRVRIAGTAVVYLRGTIEVPAEL